MKINRNIFIWIFIAISIGFLISSFDGEKNSDLQKVPYSVFLNDVETSKVTSVKIVGNNITGTLKGNQKFRTYAPFDPTLISKLEQKGVLFSAEPIDAGISFLSIFLNWLPMLFLVGVWIFFMRGMGGGAGKAMGMGKSKAKILSKDDKKATFKDVAGIDEAKAELEEIVDFLSEPEKYHRLGGKLPRGVLLVGPPGTGKTLTARAVAGEAKVPFYSISGSDFVEMFVGVGASRVRDMFEQAKKNAPCIVFIDELDAVGRRRGAGMGGGNDEREQTLNQMLVEMDGFSDNESVIIMAATNRPDVLDPALLRPGRFDRQVIVPNPDIVGREAILRVHVKKTPMSPDVNINVIARGTPGFSGADLANLVNEASLLAVRRNNKFVHHQDFEDAKDKVMMGTERRSMVLDDKEKLLTAYHEAGHAIAAIKSPASDPIHKATIVPRGRALGMVMRIPEKDRVSMSLEQIKANLVVGIGGRLAEEIVFGAEKITTGASSDIQMMTDIARRMVMEWGYSKKIGTIRLVETHEQAYLSGSNGTGISNVSEEMSKTVDSEVLRIIEEATKKCKKILLSNRKQLDILAKALIKYETLSGAEIDLVLKGKKLNRPTPAKVHKRTQNDSTASSSVPTTNPNLGKKVDKTPTKKTDKASSSSAKPSIKTDNFEIINV